MDLTNPSGDLGWDNEERMSLSARGPADLALALALVHHLAIGNNVPLDRVAAFLRRLCRRLVLEFVPKEDSQVRRLLASRDDIFPGYTEEGLEAAFRGTSRCAGACRPRLRPDAPSLRGPVSRSTGSPSRWPLTLLTGPLLLLTPFLIFVRHNGYGLFRPESLACLSGLAGAGLALGALMALGGWRVQVAVSAALVTLFVDVQTKWFAGWGAPLAATFGAALVVAWLLRRDLSSLAVLVVGSMLVVTLLTPAATEPNMTDSGASAAAGRADLPLVLHIILDQQIGVEGIPREFDPEGRLARSGSSPQPGVELAGVHPLPQHRPRSPTSSLSDEMG
jgi:hypothetical protein